MKVKIDFKKCDKSGECHYNHPELFEMGDDGFPIVLVDEIKDDAMTAHAREAMEVCPTEAITTEP
jgi:ferredoxin